MSYNNLREFIERLEREGELVRVAAEVSPVEEIAELTDRMAKQPGGGKAILFERTGTDFPVVTNLMGSERRMALALGVESLDALTRRIDALLHEVTTPKATLWEKLRMLPLLGEMARWMPRSRRGRGTCQEVVLRGEAARLSLLPVLKCWPEDGGRFVTLPMVHTLDPDTGVRNVGMYRMQVFDDRTTGMHWHVHKTGARHYDGYRRQGRRMPVAVALGGDPVYAYAATAPMPDNMDEYLLAGFLRRRPVELVRCLTCGIEVPADCDFVIEGYVDPAEEKTVEGPFGDHTGFYSLEDRYPRFHVTAITHRRDAVYPATVVGVPPEEDAYIAEATERIFLAPIRLAVQPEVRDLWMPTAGTAHNLAVVAIERRYEGQAHKVAQSLWGAGQMMFNKYLVVADAARPCDGDPGVRRQTGPRPDAGRRARGAAVAAARTLRAVRRGGGRGDRLRGAVAHAGALRRPEDGARRCGGVLRAESGAGREVRRAVRPRGRGADGCRTAVAGCGRQRSAARRDGGRGGRGGRCAQQTPRRGGASRAVPERGCRLVCDGGAGGCTLGGVRSGRDDGVAVGALPPVAVVG